MTIVVVKNLWDKDRLGDQHQKDERIVRVRRAGTINV
jgi:hypothetical protein